MCFLTVSWTGWIALIRRLATTRPGSFSNEEVLEDKEKARKKRAQQATLPGINHVAMNEYGESQARTKRGLLGGRAYAL